MNDEILGLVSMKTNQGPSFITEHEWDISSMTYQYGFGYVLLNVVQVEIACDNSDNQMVAHQCESFDDDGDFQEG